MQSKYNKSSSEEEQDKGYISPNLSPTKTGAGVQQHINKKITTMLEVEKAERTRIKFKDYKEDA